MTILTPDEAQALRARIDQVTGFPLPQITFTDITPIRSRTRNNVS